MPRLIYQLLEYEKLLVPRPGAVPQAFASESDQSERNHSPEEPMSEEERIRSEEEE